MSNSNLAKARKNKDDEFYTKLSDIESEMKFYRDRFKDKVILCNCDDPKSSNFWQFFMLQFTFLKLNRLVAVHYVSDGQSYISERIRGKEDVAYTTLQGNGDFRSDESLQLLSDADIVITNPPFSLFAEYMEVLFEHDQTFLIIGPESALSYKNVFAQFNAGKVWAGMRNPKTFETPHSQEKTFGNISWFTNMQNPKTNESRRLSVRYNPKRHPRYTNYDAINVDSLSEIPRDFAGQMGVPMSLLNSFNSDQFEILGYGKSGSVEFEDVNKVEVLKGASKGKIITLNQLYLPHNEKTDKAAGYKDTITGELYRSPYHRILVRNKNPRV